MGDRGDQVPQHDLSESSDCHRMPSGRRHAGRTDEEGKGSPRSCRCVEIQPVANTTCTEAPEPALIRTTTLTTLITLTSRIRCRCLHVANIPANADAEPTDVSVVLETLPLAALVSMPEMDLDGSGDLSKDELADAIRLHERRQLEGAAGARPADGLRSGLAILLTTLLVMVPCASPDPLSRQLRRKYRGYREASRAHAQQRAWRAELGLTDARGVLSGDQVRKSFRRRSRSCHPDRNRDDPAASKQWHLLKEARDGLLEAMPT